MIGQIWRRLTSWWVYPAGLLAFAGLVGLLSVGVGGDWIQITIRVLLFAFVAAAAYDERVRTPQIAGRQRNVETRTQFMRWLWPFVVIVVVALGIAAFSRPG